MVFIDIEQIKEQMASLADTSYVVSERHLVTFRFGKTRIIISEIFSGIMEVNWPKLVAPEL